VATTEGAAEGEAATGEALGEAGAADGEGATGEALGAAGEGEAAEAQRATAAMVACDDDSMMYPNWWTWPAGRPPFSVRYAGSE
jgi:hypothetical protein